MFRSFPKPPIHLKALTKSRSFNQCLELKRGGGQSTLFPTFMEVDMWSLFKRTAGFQNPSVSVHDRWREVGFG